MKNKMIKLIAAMLTVLVLTAPIAALGEGDEGAVAEAVVQEKAAPEAPKPEKPEEKAAPEAPKPEKPEEKPEKPEEKAAPEVLKPEEPEEKAASEAPVPEKSMDEALAQEDLADAAIAEGEAPAGIEEIPVVIGEAQETGALVGAEASGGSNASGEPEAPEASDAPDAPSEPDATNEPDVPDEDLISIEEYETPLGASEAPVEKPVEKSAQAAASEAGKDRASDQPVSEEEAVEASVVTCANAAVRVAADGLSEIFALPDEGTSLVVLGIEGDWIMVEIDGQVGYIYKGEVEDLPETDELQAEPEDGEEAVTEKKVTIFSSRRSVMKAGETIYLTSALEGFEDCETILYQWECNKGNGFTAVSGATDDHWSFSANAESLSWNWRLTVRFR